MKTIKSTRAEDIDYRIVTLSWNKSGGYYSTYKIFPNN